MPSLYCVCLVSKINLITRLLKTLKIFNFLGVVHNWHPIFLSTGLHFIVLISEASGWEELTFKSYHRCFENMTVSWMLKIGQKCLKLSSFNMKILQLCNGTWGVAKYFVLQCRKRLWHIFNYHTYIFIKGWHLGNDA